jgi:hypothetical protein
MLWLTLSLVMFSICVVLLIWAWRNKSGTSSSSDWLNPRIKFNLPARLVSSAMQTPGIQTKIVFNGQEFSGPNDMPPEIRKAYEQVMSGVLTDSDSDGIPDIVENGADAGIFTDVRTLTREDPSESLTKLNQMRDAGLITQQEYEAKRAEILSRI